MQVSATEGAQVVGIAEALGYSEAQLWASMVE